MRRNPVFFIYQFKRHKLNVSKTWPQSLEHDVCASCIIMSIMGPLHTPRHGNIHSSVNTTDAGQLLQFPDWPICDLWWSKLMRVCCQSGLHSWSLGNCRVLWWQVMSSFHYKLKFNLEKEASVARGESCWWIGNGVDGWFPVRSLMSPAWARNSDLGKFEMAQNGDWGALEVGFLTVQTGFSMSKIWILWFMHNHEITRYPPLVKY